MISVKNPRAQAAKLLLKIVDQGFSLNELLSDYQDGPGVPLMKEMLYGSLRWYYALNTLLSELLNKPLRNKDRDVHCLLIIGLYELIYMKTPEHAVVSEMVNATHALRKSWAKGFCNGVLRAFIREDLKFNDEQWAHPSWMLEVIKKSYPEHWQVILEANNARAPMFIRVHGCTRDEYLKRLADVEIPAAETPFCKEGIHLAKPCAVNDLPGFAQGKVFVQDLAAQLTPSLLPLKPGMKVLDLCSAPGGKATHLLAKYPGIELWLCDKDEKRFERVNENLKRLKLEKGAHCCIADATRPKSYTTEGPFDAILLDAPCSALGVIRRHPDIKLLRRAEDIDALVTLQRELLTANWPLLKKGGTLLYATCSILPAENQGNMTWFLDQHEDAKEDAIDAQWGMPVTHGRQIFPGQDAMDGFYYCRLQKIL